MIHLKVFVSSVQKELRSEPLAIGSVLTTDEAIFLLVESGTVQQMGTGRGTKYGLKGGT